MLQTVASVVAVAHACAARVSRTVHKFREATAQPVFEAEVQTAQVNWGTVGYFSLMITVRMAGLILVMLQSDDGQSQRGSLRMLPGLANAGSGCVGVLDPPFECLRKLQDNIMLNNTVFAAMGLALSTAATAVAGIPIVYSAARAVTGMLMGVMWQGQALSTLVIWMAQISSRGILSAVMSVFNGLMDDATAAPSELLVDTRTVCCNLEEKRVLDADFYATEMFLSRTRHQREGKNVLSERGYASSQFLLLQISFGWDKLRECQDHRTAQAAS